MFPVLCGAATSLAGVDLLLDQICTIGPSPLSRGPVTVIAGGEVVEIAPTEGGDTLAVVFKSIADRHLGQLSLIKVVSGTLRADDHLNDSRSGADVRLHSLLSMVGGDQKPIDLAAAGDIVAVAKLSDVHTNDTLAPKSKPVTIPPIVPPKPTLPVAIHARTTADEDKLSNALSRACSTRTPRCDSTATTKPTRPSFGARARRICGWRWNGSNASSASRSTPATSRSPIARPLPAAPRRKAATRSSPAGEASTGWRSCG